MKEKPDPYRDQVMRLSALAFFPQYPDGARELKKMLKLRAKSLEHATRVIDRILETSENCPAPMVIQQLCRDVPVEPQVPLPAGCARCQGGDWIYVEIRGYPCSRRCDCDRGKRLDAEDHKHKAEYPRAHDGKMLASGGDE